MSHCHSNGHIETMPASEINPFTALTRIRCWHIERWYRLHVYNPSLDSSWSDLPPPYPHQYFPQFAHDVSQLAVLVILDVSDVSRSSDNVSAIEGHRWRNGLYRLRHIKSLLHGVSASHWGLCRRHCETRKDHRSIRPVDHGPASAGFARRWQTPSHNMAPRQSRI